MKAVSLGCLFVDDIFQLRQVSGAGPQEFLLQGYLQHDILQRLAGCLRKRAFLFDGVHKSHIHFLPISIIRTLAGYHSVNSTLTTFPMTLTGVLAVS